MFAKSTAYAGLPSAGRALCASRESCSYGAGHRCVDYLKREGLDCSVVHAQETEDSAEIIVVSVGAYKERWSSIRHGT